MSAHITVNTWILQENLPFFLQRISVLVGYRFEDWDWDAIRFGIRATDIKQDHWYEYSLNGHPPVELAFARAEDANRLHIKLETGSRTADNIEALARIMQCYEEASSTPSLEMLIEAAFIETHLPDQDKLVACDAAHLAYCSECQEAFSFFRGKHWISLLQANSSLPSPLPGSYAGLGFLTQDARRFFFPAYLVKAIHDEDKELLEEALGTLRQTTWTPLQQELIDFARHLLHIGVA